MLSDLQADFENYADPKTAETFSRFFKTGLGEYGEGDCFVGLTVPQQRSLAKKYVSLSLKDVERLLWSPIHEHRLTGLLILVYRSKQADGELRKSLFDFYMANISRVNNWDLVDCTAEHLVGRYLDDKDRSVLYSLAGSQSLWERRIAMVSCLYFIKRDDFKDALRIAKLLLEDKQDLIHKAVGWMLREVGKRDLKVLESFLEVHARTMPRTALRYAIERFSPERRRYFMRR